MAIYNYGTTIVETAANSLEELTFLAEIVKDQLDPARKLAYAEWLEERGDPRGNYLRVFVQAASDPSAKIPHTDEFPMSWLQVVGIHPLTLIREQITGLHAALLEKTLMRSLKPNLHMKLRPMADENLLPGVSKFGGLPDLPQGMDWPTDSYDNGLLFGVFCAQIHLRDIQHTLVSCDLPRDGLLSFFADELKSPVRYFAENSNFVRMPPPNERMRRFFGEFYPLPSGAVHFIEGVDFLIRYDEGLWPRDVVEENWDALSAIDLMMIPPCFETDSRFGIHHQLMGNGQEFNGYPPPDLAPGNCRLAKFGTFSDSCYWGDSANPIFYVSTDDLLNGRFENAKSYCG